MAGDSTIIDVTKNILGKYIKDDPLNFDDSSYHLVDQYTTQIGDFTLYNESTLTDELPENYKGTTSLFNEYNVFFLAKASLKTDSSKLDKAQFFDSYIDRSDKPSNYKQKELHDYKAPTAQRLIKMSNNNELFGYGAAPYSWSDFLYCKYYGRIPNNQLITLRRYSSPVHDNLEMNIPNENGDAVIKVAHPPIAQAVTWLGKETKNQLSEILRFSFGLKWKELEAKVQQIMGNEIGFGAGIEGLLGAKTISTIAKGIQLAETNKDIMSGRAEKMQNWRKKAWTDDGPYWNQIYGPVNVINKTHIRDRGVKFENNINLYFHYTLSSINGVNPKIAMLDIISNMLSLTYNNAKFWGGAIRYFGDFSSSILFKGDISAFYNGDGKTYANSLYDGLSKEIKKTGKLLSETAHLNTSEGLKEFFSSIADSGEKIVGVMAKKLLDTAYAKFTKHSRPEFLSIRNLLSGDPVGEWHLTIGNPMNPIAVIGNLLVDDVEMKFGDKLGADDFPTELTFKIKLKHARPRDKGDIESIFNLGKGRLAYSPLAQLSSEHGTFGDDWKNDMRNQDVSHAMNGNINGQSLNSPDAKKMRTVDPNQENNSIHLNSQGISLIKNRVKHEWGNHFDNALLDNMIQNKKTKA